MFFRIIIVGHYAEIVLVVSQSSADHAVGLVPVNHFVKFLALCGCVGTHVEPQFRDGSVVGKQFFQLLFGVIMMTLRDEICIVW